MLLIAFRNLFQEKTRFLISVGGVAFSIVLMVTLLGIYDGAVSQFTRFIVKNPIDLVIAKDGIGDFFHGVSLIATSDLKTIEREPAIKKVVPMITQRGFVEDGGRKYDFYLYSFDPGEPQGAPWKLSQGTQQIGLGEIVLSDVLAKKLGKTMNDQIELFDHTFRIKGLAAEASSIGLNYAWVSFDQARAMVTYPEQVNFAYVTLNDPASAETTAARLQASYPHLSVLDKPTFVANNLAEIEESYLPIIRAIVMISIVIGIAVIGLTIYTATIDKAREYGILKAIGVTNRQLYLIVLTQAVISMLIGLGIGIGLSYLLAQGLADWINLLPEISGHTVQVVVALGLGMGFVASFVPIRRLVTIDPAEVFKS